MAKSKTFLKPGKVVVILNGRHAGKKAVILKTNDPLCLSKKKKAPRCYGNCLVAGLDRVPKPITKGMSYNTIKRRIHCKPFLKVINWNHFMPTRFVSSPL